MQNWENWQKVDLEDFKNITWAMFDLFLDSEMYFLETQSREINKE